MAEQRRLMCIFAHPDDESLGTGSTLAKYAAEGVDVYLLTATRGERGWQGEPDAHPGLQALGELRTAELVAAARVLGIRELQFLNYIDGDLDRADTAEAIARIVPHLRRVKPQVVITFGPDGSYGHPDHIAISQLTGAAILCAADATYIDQGQSPAHRVAKLYYMVDTTAEVELYTSVLGDLVFPVDGVERKPVGWDEWAVTTRIDATEHWRATLDAVSCHTSQLPGYAELAALPEDRQRSLWGVRSYYRAFSLVNSGRQREHDLFEGLL